MVLEALGEVVGGEDAVVQLLLGASGEVLGTVVVGLLLEAPDDVTGPWNCWIIELCCHIPGTSRLRKQILAKTIRTL